MTPTLKKILDYIVVLVCLYFIAVGLKTLMYVIVDDIQHPLVSVVDLLRFNTEIGLVIFYIKNISLREKEHISVYKSLVLMCFWPLILNKITNVNN